MFWRKRKNLAQQRANKRRKGIMALVVPWLRRFGFGFALLAGVIWVGAWFFLSDADTHAADWAHEKMLGKTAALGFTVKDILVEGRVHTDAEVLMAIINIQKDDPLLAFDPAQAQAQIEKITWVKNAHVQRRFPNAIYIGLNERKPMALWQSGKTLQLLDEDGAVINADSIMPFKDLLIVTGQGAPEEAPDLIRNIAAEDSIAGMVESAARISDRRWDLKLKNGLIVKLPENDIGLAMRRLALSQEQDNMLNKDLMSIDLRDESRMVVRTKLGKGQEYKATFKPAETKAGNNI